MEDFERNVGIPTIRLDLNNPEQTLADLAAAEDARYKQDYVPVEDDAIRSLHDMSIVKQARANAGEGFNAVKGRFNRARSRYGVAQRAIDTREQEQGFQLAKSKTLADTVNNSRLEQFDRNRGFRNELINIGRGVAADAQGNITDAAGLKTSRDNSNRAAAANAKAQRTGAIGSIASTALYAAMVM